VQPFPNMMAGGGFDPRGWNPATLKTDGLGGTVTGAHNQSVGWQNTSGGVAILGAVGHAGGKHYFEIEFTYVSLGGIEFAVSPAINPNSTYRFGWYSGYGLSFGTAGVVDADSGANGGAISVLGSGNDVTAMIAVDQVNNLAWFGVNGTWQPISGYGATANPATGVGGVPIVHTVHYPGLQAINPNSFAANLRTISSMFAYAPPAGFAPWANL